MQARREIKRRWIEDRLKQLGKNKRELADAMSIPASRLTELLNGDRNLKPAEATRAAKFLTTYTSTVWDAFGYGAAVGDYGKVVITAYCDAASGEIVVRNGLDVGVLEEIDAPFPGYFGRVVRIKGNSMAPRYRDGEIIAFTPGAGDVAKLIGEEAIVGTIDGRMVLKIIARGTTAQTYTLLSLNRDEEPIQNVAIEWVAGIDWHLPRRSALNRKPKQ